MAKKKKNLMDELLEESPALSSTPQGPTKTTTTNTTTTSNNKLNLLDELLSQTKSIKNTANKTNNTTTVGPTQNKIELPTSISNISSTKTNNALNTIKNNIATTNDITSKILVPIKNTTNTNTATTTTAKTTELPVNVTNEDGYTYFGKTYGDYSSINFSTMGNYKVYKKDDNFYYYDEANKTYKPMTIAFMTSEEQAKKDKAAADAAGKQYSNVPLKDQLILDSSNLSDEKKKEYSEDAIRKAEKAASDYEKKMAVDYDAPGIQRILHAGKKISNTVDENIIEPAKNIADIYEVGKKNNELSLEYYNEMVGNDNNLEEKKTDMDYYNYFNSDLVNDDSWLGSAVKNANTQVESIKRQGVAATILAGIGAIGGGMVAGPEGAVAGAKTLGSLGYTFGSTPYTYKLEAGNEYQSLIDMGVPKDVAKKYSIGVGATNAAIEVGENIIDLATLGINTIAGKTGEKVVTKEAINDMVDEYGESTVKSWLKDKLGEKGADAVILAGKSYAQNIASEAGEEMTQETASILGERLAANESGVERNTTVKEDIDRVLQAGKEAAISTAFTAPLSSLGGGIIGTASQSVQNNISANVTKQELINQATENAEKTLGRKLYEEETEYISNNIKNNYKQIVNNIKSNTAFKITEQEKSNAKTQRQQTLLKEFNTVANNTDEAHELYTTLNDIQKANDTHSVHIVTTEQMAKMDGINLKKQSDGSYTLANGKEYIPRGFNYKNGDLYVNIDVGKTSATQAIYHEMLEGFKKSDSAEYETLKGMIKDVIGKDYQSELTKYQEMYGTELTDDIEDEYLNDKFGELAESDNLINKIADDRNVLEKFIDKIKNFVKYITSSKERKQLIKLKNRLEQEFVKRYGNTDFSNNNENVALSMQKNYNNLKTRQLDSIVIQKYSNSKKKFGYVTDANNFYIIENNDYGNYNIYDAIEIDGNEDKIKKYEREFDAYDKHTKSNNTPIERTTSRERSSSWYNVDTREETWGEFVSRVLEEIESRGLDSREYFKKSSGDVGNTSFSLLESKSKEEFNNEISNLRNEINNITTGEELKNTFKKVFNIYQKSSDTNYKYEVVENNGMYGTKFESDDYKPDIKYHTLNEEIKIQKENMNNWLDTLNSKADEIVYNNQNKVTPTIGKEIDSINDATPITTKEFKKELSKHIDEETKDISGKFESKDGHLYRDGKEIKYVYRAINQAEMDFIKENGYIKSNQDKNIGYEVEQGLTDYKDTDPSWYLPRNADGYILKVEIKPENGFFYTEDEYAKTPNKIPVSQIVEINGEKINQDIAPVKNVDNTNSTTNDDIRYSLVRATDEQESLSIDDKINQSMTMDEAKDMIQRIFTLNDIKNWYDDKYKNGDEWARDVDTSEIEMYGENTELIQSKYLNKLYDKDNGYGDDYYLSDIIDAYKNGTLIGETKQDIGRVDTTKDTGYNDNRFYAPKNIELTKELYEQANQRVTKANSQDVYKARADFIIAVHDKGMAEQIGLTQDEINAKLKIWANYTPKTYELSKQLNENVSKQNQWSGLENSSIVNTISISNDDMAKMVKEIKGDSNGWQRQYITGTMLAIDTHIDYSNLTFDFEQGKNLREKNAAGDYNSTNDVIRIGDGYQNTVAHEMGHYIDYSWGEQLFGRKDTLSSLVKSYDKSKFTNEQIQFLEHFNEFQESIEKSGEQGDTLSYGSSRNANYWQKPTETFARFVGKFTEWVKNKATNNRYGYEDKFYHDNFNENQYKEFVKILQEKSVLDTTKNEDINYSLTSNKSLTNELTVQDIAPIRQDLSNLTTQVTNLSNQIQTLQNGTQNQATTSDIAPIFQREKDANDFQDYLTNEPGYIKSLNSQAESNALDDTTASRISSNVMAQLGINSKQSEDVKSIVNKAANEDLTVDEIESELAKYDTIENTYTNDNIENIKKKIKSIPINVTDNIKMNIADYNAERKSVMGKMNITSSGLPVDIAYNELNSYDPNTFPSDIVNPVDQLLKIMDVSKMSSEIIETTDVDPEDIRATAQYVKDTIMQEKANSELYSDFNTNQKIQRNDVEDIAPTKYNTKENIEKVIKNRDITPVEQTQKKVKKPNKVVTAFREMITNRNAEIDNIARDTRNKNITFAAEMLDNVSAEANSNINNHQTDINGVEVGKGVKEIFAPAKKAGLYSAFNDYLLQKSNIERTAVGKGSTIPLEISQELVNKYEQEHPEFKTWSSDVYKYFDNVLKQELDAGLITNDQYKYFRGENGIYRSYVPFYPGEVDSNRYFDDEGKVKAVSTLKKSKGGADKILNVEDAMIKQTRAYKAAIRQNLLNYELVMSLSDGRTDSVGIDTRGDNVFDLSNTAFQDTEGNYQVAAYVNGQQITAGINQALYRELTDSNPLQQALAEGEELLSKPLGVVQKLNNVRRNLLTSWNPTFLITNGIKDIQDAVINSKHTGRMMLNYLPSFVELRQANTKEAKQFLSLYGNENLMGNYSGKSNFVSRANEIVELAPRFAEFKASLQAGDSLQEALHNAREVTTNFGRGGYVTKALNRNGFTFLNASVQGLDKVVRNLSGQNGVKGVTSVIVKGVLFGVAPALLNNLFFGFGDDKDEDYEALPDYIKDNYYLIKLPSGSDDVEIVGGSVVTVGQSKFLRIPKGRVTSVIGSAARRAVEFVEGDTDSFSGWADNAWSQIGVGDGQSLTNPLSNTMLAPLTQAFGSENGTAWYGGDIVPTRLQDVPAAEQTDSTIDSFSTWLGSKINVSPYKINYVLDQYSGGIGDVVLPAITEATNNGASGWGYLLAPLKDKFVVNSVDDNKYAGEFYDLKDKLEVNSNSVMATDEDSLMYSYMSSVSSELSKLYKEKREVQSDTTLDNATKYQKVQAIQSVINEKSQDALNNYNKGFNTSNYGKYGDYEYYKNTKNEWTEVSDSDAEFTLGMNTEEKNEYYKTKNSITTILNQYKEDTDGLDSKDESDKEIIEIYSAEKRENITKAISNSNLDDYTKGQYYAKYYSSEDTMANAINSGFTFESYTSAIDGIDEVRDKYSKENGYTTAQRKAKVISYINKQNLSIPQKAMLLKKYYSSYDTYNTTIINYISKLDLTKDEKISILEEYGFKVSSNGRVSWK